MHTKNTDQSDMPAVVGAALSDVTHRVSLWYRADLPSLLPAYGGGGGGGAFTHHCTRSGKGDSPTVIRGPKRCLVGEIESETQPPSRGVHPKTGGKGMVGDPCSDCGLPVGVIPSPHLVLAGDEMSS